MLDFSQINIWAVLVAVVVTMVLGFLWYSPVLFGNAWVKQRGMKMEEMSGGGSMIYVLTALTALIGVLAIALLASMIDEITITSGVVIGLLVGIAVSSKIGMNYLFENGKMGLYLITIGYHLVAFLVAGLIIGAWTT